jgi:hypothetical protein
MFRPLYPGFVCFPAGRKNGRADPLPFSQSKFSVLLFVNSFLQLGPRGELRDLAGGDFDSGASLRIAPVPRLSLRYRESAETYQSHPIPFA